MHDFTGAPCVTPNPDEQRILTAIFDSTDPTTSAHARKLCTQCPHQIPCRARLSEAITTATHRGKDGPTGTWAGATRGKPAARPRKQEAS